MCYCVTGSVMSIIRLSCILGLFFFFKQKTAYEMRICDWSSDVCSSDLNKEGLVGAVVHRRLELSLAQLVQVDSRLVSPSEQLLRLARGILDFSVSDIGRAMLRLLAAASLQDKA